MKKTYLAVIEESESGFVVLESEERSLEEIARFFEYHEALESEYDNIKKSYDSLTNRYESCTIRNERFLHDLLQIFTAIGVYDFQKNTLNLEPVLKPYFEKMLADNLKREGKKNRLMRKIELWKYKAGVDAKTKLLKSAWKIAMFFFNKKSKAKEAK